MIALTVSAASSMVRKSNSRVATSGGSWVSRTQIRVAIPSVPSPPMKAPRRSYPAASPCSSPSTTTSPSDKTTSTA